MSGNGQITHSSVDIHLAHTVPTHHHTCTNARTHAHTPHAALNVLLHSLPWFARVACLVCVRVLVSGLSGTGPAQAFACARARTRVRRCACACVHAPVLRTRSFSRSLSSFVDRFSNICCYICGPFTSTPTKNVVKTFWCSNKFLVCLNSQTDFLSLRICQCFPMSH